MPATPDHRSDALAASASLSPEEQPRELSGFWLVGVLQALERRVGREGVEAVLEAAGEERDLEVLYDYATWTSHDRFRAIMRHAAAGFGGLEALARTDDLVSEGDFGYIDAMHAQGSTEAIFASLADVASSISTTFRYASERVSDGEWLVRGSAEPGFEPFPEMCALNTAAFRRFPRLFGYTEVDVVEESCQTTGAGECVFRVRWSVESETARLAEFLALRTQILEARNQRFHEFIGDLAGDEPKETLRAIVADFASIGVAPVTLLVSEDPWTGRRSVIGVGVDDAGAECLAAQLDAGGLRGDDTVHTVEVKSARYRHGYLAVIGSGVPWEQVCGPATVHAQVAAVALDVIAAHDEVRRQASSAEALVELSIALADIASPGETASKLARATPGIIGCERALVFLPDVAGGKPLLSAARGYDADELARIRASLFGHAVSGDMTALDRIDECLARSGVDDAIVEPIGSPNGPIGWICGSRPDDRKWTAESRGRLRGVAAQAATAIRNSHLLDQIRHQALHDGLTGLPNRSLIHDRLGQMLMRARRSAEPVAVLFLDLDGFKGVNDRFGHEAGDELLCAVAGRLSETVRESDVVGRLGGDEFVVVSEGASGAQDPELLAERIISVLGAPFDIAAAGERGSSVTIGASLGIARGDRQSPSEILRDADLALYEAKRAGKGRYVRFASNMHTAARDQALLERDLRRALDNDQFELWYQPIFDLSTDLVTGVEALLRWQDPVRGLVLPDEFMPTLESSGLIVDVGGWAVSEACRQGAEWHRHGFAINVSVNLSARQLECDTIVELVRMSLASSGLPASSLILEIKETSIMRDTAAAISRLNALKQVGVQIAIDDFGTGYSSLAYLQQFPVDAIKIDRSFIAAMTETPEAGAIIRALVGLGKTLGLETLAEGIEQHHQLRRLEETDCDSGQGLLFGGPVAVDGIEQLLVQRAVARE